MSRRRSFALALVVAGALPALAAEPQLTGGELVRRTASDPAAVAAGLGSAGPEWLAWSVPALAEAAEICCHDRAFDRSGCSLADRQRGWGSRGSDSWRAMNTDLLIFAEIERGEPRRIELVGARCPVDAAGHRVLLVEGVEPARSLDWLARLARRGSGADLSGIALGAVAYHASPSADRLLAEIARDREVSPDAREEAIFWSGNLRGEAGYQLLDTILASEPEADLREHTLFALTQSTAPGALPRLRRAAREDRDPDVRGQALFWLGQSESPSAAEWIREAIASDPDEEVREQGVFALSQLRGGASELAALLRESKDPGVRRQALFWLASSQDPQALEALEDVLGTARRSEGARPR